MRWARKTSAGRTSVSELFSGSFPPVARSVPDARHAVLECLHNTGLDDLACEAALLTSELVTNAVLHARTSVDLAVDWDGTSLRVQAADDSARPPQPQALTDTKFSGRGLAIIAAVAKQWGFEPSDGAGKLVWFELDARTDQREAV
jgi:anti-sigma regulatory factor (Ser/Thr protein kinase)